MNKDRTDDDHEKHELAQLRAAIDASADRVYLIDYESMRFIYVNRAACESAGVTARQHLEKLEPHMVLRTTPERVRQEYEKVIDAGEQGMTSEMETRDKDGNTSFIELHRRALHLNGRWLIVSITHDITARKRTEQANERLRRMFAALSTTNEAILHAESPGDLYQRVCDAAVEGGRLIMAGVLVPDTGTGRMGVVASAGATGVQSDHIHSFAELRKSADSGLAGSALHSGNACVSNDLLNDPGMKPWHEIARKAGIAAGAALPLLQGGEAIGVLLFYSDEPDAFDVEIMRLLERMSENLAFALENFKREEQRRRNEEQIQYLATHDSLTELPNRVMFNEVLNINIETARRYERQFAVLFIDLDRFKIINDSLGHEAGDALLKTIAERLKSCLRASDVVARLGGDEFIVMLQEAGKPDQVQTVAHNIISAVLKPVEIQGQDCRVTASIGITVYPDDGQDAATLIKNADMAMYLAKEEGKNNYQFFYPDIKTRSLEHMALETNLRRAIENDELSLDYQAKLDLTTGEICGVEALLRWNSEELGVVTPTELIPIAEETGLIIPIGRWVLRTACRQNMEWQRQGLEPVCMAVNLSPRQFTDSDLLGDIAAVLEETGMPAGLLELEITESMVMYDIGRAVILLKELKKMGVRIAIDDFGTGYSSLSQLKQFPIDSLKVDRSFIRELSRDTDDSTITEAIISMGKSLNLTVIAEGVENSKQQVFLREHACDQMQGYYFSHPVAPETFAELLSTHKAEPGK